MASNKSAKDLALALGDLGCRAPGESHEGERTQCDTDNGLHDRVSSLTGIYDMLGIDGLGVEPSNGQRQLLLPPQRQLDC